MTKIVDARGLSCPQPVILARQAIAEGEFPIQVLVDTATSQQNVTRLAQKAGLTVTQEESADDIKLILTRE